MRENWITEKEQEAEETHYRRFKHIDTAIGAKEGLKYFIENLTPKQRELLNTGEITSLSMGKEDWYDRINLIRQKGAYEYLIRRQTK